MDDDRHWDIVGLSTFGVLMGLGGGFIRDLLIGNLPVESLRTPWYLTTVIGAIVVALLVTAVYALVDVWDPQIAGLAGIITAVGAHFAARQFGLRTRRAEGPSGLLLTRSKK